MAQLKTRYEHANDATYRANAAVRGARLVNIVAASDSAAPKPRVAETTADDGSQGAVGAVLADQPVNADVTVVHRGWQRLHVAAAVVLGELVYSASAGRVRGAAAVGTIAVAAGARPYGRALSAQPTVDGFVWVKVFGN